MGGKMLASLSPQAKSIVAGGLYQHYKGPHYKVISVAHHSETLEELVVYTDESGDMWVRPLDMFVETIIVDEQSRPRFKLVQ